MFDGGKIGQGLSIDRDVQNLNYVNRSCYEKIKQSTVLQNFNDITWNQFRNRRNQDSKK